jgi:hypothetical protein
MPVTADAPNRRLPGEINGMIRDLRSSHISGWKSWASLLSASSRSMGFWVP